MRGFSSSPGYTRARAVFGVLFIVLGALIVAELIRKVGVRLETIPGLLLGAAMMALGYVRVRAAFTVGKPPK